MADRQRILVIEDDRPTRELLAAVLSADGHQVVLEATGLAGRARAISESFDLILSDIGLPDLDGIALAHQIRAAGVRIRTLALSGHAEEADRQRGRAAGFDDYLFKPIKASTLRAEIARQLEGATTLAAPGTASRVQPGPPVTDRTDPTATAAPPQLVAAPLAPRRRGVLGGLVVIAMGIPFILQPLGVPNAASYLFVAMGGAFLISYLRGQSRRAFMTRRAKPSTTSSPACRRSCAPEIDCFANGIKATQDAKQRGSPLVGARSVPTL